MRKHWRLYVFMAGFVYGLLTLASCSKSDDDCPYCEGEIIEVVMTRSDFGTWVRASTEKEDGGCLNPGQDDSVISEFFDLNGNYVVKFYNCKGTRYEIN